MCTGLAALAAINGREEYYRSAGRLWNNMTGRRMHVNGGVGAARNGEAFGSDYICPATVTWRLRPSGRASSAAT